MNMTTHARKLVAAAAALTLTAGALANPQIEKIRDMLDGSWRTTQPVGIHGGDAGATSHIVMHAAPVEIESVPNALYVELSHAGSMDRPYRQAIFSLYEYKSGVRLRTYEFHTQPGHIVGMWATPELFPQIDRDAMLYATLDIDLRPSSDGFAGSTPYAYPTGVRGAVEMTSSIEITPDRLATADKGMSADGKVAWGPDQSGFEWTRFDPGIVVETSETGLVQIIYDLGTGRPAADGDTIWMNYSGWLPDGTQFDSSRAEGKRPLPCQIPGRLIPGWNEMLPGAMVGTKRRLIIPSELGYGERGFARAGIPPNSTLVFEIEAMDIQRPPADREPGAAAGGNPSGGG
jgi:hypothetical protein